MRYLIPLLLIFIYAYQNRFGVQGLLVRMRISGKKKPSAVAGLFRER